MFVGARKKLFPTYCFEGIPQNSIGSIGTVASGLLFETGFFKMIEVFYGSDNLPCIESVRQKINIVSFKSERAISFEENHREKFMSKSVSHSAEKIRR